MTIDLLTYQPKSCDYPNFRNLMSKYGNLFNQKFLYISEHNSNEITPDIDSFLIPEYTKLGFTYVEPPRLRVAEEDWCDFAIKAMLEKSKADTFLIIHPDFLAEDFPLLIAMVEHELETSDLVGYTNGEYIEPAFFACKRKSYNKSCKDFSARDGFDHCNYLSKNMMDKGMKIKYLQGLGLINRKDFYHLGGATQAYIWGLTMDEYRREVDYVSLWWALKKDVPMNQIYVDRVSKIIALCKEKFPNVNPETHWLRRFF